MTDDTVDRDSTLPAVLISDVSGEFLEARVEEETQLGESVQVRTPPAIEYVASVCVCVCVCECVSLCLSLLHMQFPGQVAISLSCTTTYNHGVVHSCSSDDPSMWELQ
jgi:hypothetical protein